MAPEKAPAFQFYPKDFLVAVAGLTLAERGRLFTRVAQTIVDRDKDRLQESDRRFIGRIYWHDGTSRPRPYIHPSILRTVLERDAGRCRLCGSDERLEFDHVVPFSRGGPGTVENLQLLCNPCNRRKGAKLNAG